MDYFDTIFCTQNQIFDFKQSYVSDQFYFINCIVCFGARYVTKSIVLIKKNVNFLIKTNFILFRLQYKELKLR